MIDYFSLVCWALLEAVHMIEFLTHTYTWNISEYTKMTSQPKTCSVNTFIGDHPAISSIMYTIEDYKL